MKKEGTKLVTVSLEEAMAYRMTPEQKARFDAIRDEDIDYSDIPDTSDMTGWMQPGPLVSTLAPRKAPDASETAATSARITKRDERTLLSAEETRVLEVETGGARFTCLRESGRPPIRLCWI